MKSNKGFSLVELIVVIAIMAIIAAVAVPVYNTYITKAQTGSDANTIAEVAHASKIAAAFKGTDVTYKWNDAKTVLTVTFADAATAAEAAGVLKGIVAYTANASTFTVTFESAVDTAAEAVVDALKGFDGETQTA